MTVEAVTATTALVAVCAAAVVLVALVVVLVRSRRRGGDSRQEVLALVAELNQRLEVIVRELSGSLERAQEERRRNRVLGELCTSIDLDEVLARTLEAAAALPG